MRKVFSSFIVILIGIALTGCSLQPATPKNIEFSLLGESIIELELGEEYIELGFITTVGDVDLSASVSVSGTVDTSVAGVYKLEYTFQYNTNSYKITRFVVINKEDISYIDFRLNGETIIELEIGDEYLEEGFIASDNGESIVDSVVIEGTVDENTIGVYFIKYILTIDEDEVTLLRAVTVVNSTFTDPDEIMYDGICENVEIHYIDLGAMGDSTLIDCGDFEILIDAGLKSGGTNIVVPYLQNFVTDGIIEILIATHPDADHIGGFVGLSGELGVFDAFTVERVLDYGYDKTTNTHEQYAELRDASGALICNGHDALTSADLCQPYYTITEDLILRVIDTGFYENHDSSNDNENSIVVILEHIDLTFLFTGDAEFDAEEFMADYLGQVDVYKAGHHGSHTASSEALLSVIQPTDIILSVHFPDDDDGENGYGIPQQESLDRLFGYTDNIYATGVNGNIILVSNGSTYIITGSINSILLKDSVWFSEHRVYPTE